MNWSRIRQERKKKGYTLAKVAQETGYSIGYISQLERNLKQPSLAALRRIANCLQCSEVWLIMGNSSQSPIPSVPEPKTPSRFGYAMKKRDRVPMKIPEIDTAYSIFTPSVLPGEKKPAMTGLLVTIRPGAWVTETMILHQTMDESVFVLKGQLEAHVGTHVYNVSEGDCVYIPQNTLHNYLNTGQEEAQCMIYFSDLIY